MGSQVSAVRKQLKEKEDKQAAEQQLNILEKMVNAHLDRIHREIIEGERGDQQIHTGTVVFAHRMIYIKAKKKASDEVVNAVGDIFKGDFKDGIADLIKSVANTILGNTSIGQFESQEMFILWNSNALLRVDVYYYRWNFASKAVIKESDHVMGVLIMKRVINLAKTNIEVLTWAISETAKRTKTDVPQTFLTKAFKMLSKVISVQTRLRALELTAKGGSEEEETTGKEIAETKKAVVTK